MHCKTNKDLGPGRSVQDRRRRPDGCGRTAAHAHRFYALLPLRGAWCVKACPTGAMQKREKDGIVFVKSSLCIGCKSCIAACPWGTPQWDPVTKKGGEVRLLYGSVDAGLKPACVTKCVTGCLSFGVANEVPDPRRERYAHHIIAEPLDSGKEEL